MMNSLHIDGGKNTRDGEVKRATFLNDVAYTDIHHSRFVFIYELNNSGLYQYLPLGYRLSELRYITQYFVLAFDMGEAALR